MCSLLWSSCLLQYCTWIRLGSLPPETHVYVGHEYTAESLRESQPVIWNLSIALQLVNCPQQVMNWWGEESAICSGCWWKQRKFKANAGLGPRAEGGHCCIRLALQIEVVRRFKQPRITGNADIHLLPTTPSVCNLRCCVQPTLDAFPCMLRNHYSWQVQRKFTVPSTMKNDFRPNFGSSRYDMEWNVKKQSVWFT